MLPSAQAFPHSGRRLTIRPLILSTVSSRQQYRWSPSSRWSRVIAAGLALIASQASAQSFPPEIDLSQLAGGDGSTGFVLNGADNGDMSGTSVSAVGDVNGDGIDDLLIGAPKAETDIQVRAGVSYLVFGRDAAGGFPAEFELSSLAAGDGSAGFVVYGEGKGSNYNAGIRVSGGDINGDGIDDLIIGDRYFSRTYVLYGRSAGPGGFPPEVSLASLPSGDGSTGFAFSGAGGRVSGEAGDINGDGIDDLVVAGIFFETPVTGASIVYGRNAAAGGIPADVDWYESIFTGDGSDGFVIYNADDGDGTGYAIDTGDINGDGHDDLILGAPFGLWVDDCPDGGCWTSGAVRVLYGRAAADENFRVQTRTDFSLSGDGGAFGKGVAAGDVNGDGIDDIVIGQPTANPGGREYAGATYVVYGTAEAPGVFPFEFDLDALVTGDGSAGFVVNGIQPGDGAGEKVAVGDVNGDGNEDIIISNGRYAGSVPSQVHVVFGRDAAAGGFPAEFELSSLAAGDGSNGFVLGGLSELDSTIGEAGAWLSAGDINGDGVDDVIVGDALADLPGRNNAGKTYVVFGRSEGTPTGSVLSIENSPAAVEGDYLKFKVRLSQPVYANVSFDVRTIAGTATATEDYQEKGGSRLFAPGETERTLWVQTVDDETIEPNETLRLRLSKPENAELGKASAKGVIVDNDDTSDWARLTVANARAAEGGRARFELTLSKPTKKDVKIAVQTIDVTASANLDYAPKGGIRIIPAGETRATINVEIAADDVVEGQEKFRLRVEVRSNNAVVVHGNATGTITGP